MGEYAPTIPAGVPHDPLLSIGGGVEVEYPARLTPSVHSGYFYAQDRQYYLFGRKASCYLEDITWYRLPLAGTPIAGTEQVWVNGIDITGSGQYGFDGGYILINGTSITHPGTLIEEVNYDTTLLDPIDLGGVFDPSTSVFVTYDFTLWASSTDATLDIVDGTATVAGINMTSTIAGAGGNSIIININVSGGAGSTATVTSSGTANPNEYDLDWFDSTTVATVVTALGGAGLPWTVADDGNGTPASDLFSALLAAASITPASAEQFTGGVTAGYSTSSTSESGSFADAEIIFQFPQHPTLNAPVTITDDRMHRWDRRNISPEFIVTDDAELIFNTPKNEILNPDFEASSDLDFWMITGSPVTAVKNTNFTLSKARSGSRFVQMSAANHIAQIVPVTDELEHIFSVALRDTDGATGNGIDVDITFYDASWSSLGTYNDTIDVTSHPTILTDWTIANITFGPSNRLRTYDHVSFTDATWALIDITANEAVDIDYVYWGQTPLEPDHWIPHPHMTVEFEAGEDEYYEHQPLIVYDHYTNPKANAVPLETCNTHSVSNVVTDGFLYFYEYDGVADFGLGLGGTNAPVGEFDRRLQNWPTLAPSNGNQIIPIPGGGFYLIGSFSSLAGHSTAGIAKVHPDGTVDTSFTVASVGGGSASCAAYDAENDILYVGGTFTDIGGTARNRAAALDGTDATLLSFNPNFNNTVLSIAVDVDDTAGVVVYFAGLFTDVNSGTTRNRAAAVLASTGVAQAWDPDVGAQVNKVLLGDDRKIYLGGQFTTVTGGGDTRNRIARYDATSATTTLDSGWSPDIDNGSVFDLFIHDLILYIGGSFTSVDSGTTRNRAAAVATVTDAIQSWDPNAGSTVSGIWVAGDRVLLAGAFTTVGGETRNRAAMVGLDGTVDAWDPNFDASVNDIAENEGVIATVGPFTGVGSDTVTAVAFFKYYDGEPVPGRRWLPYAKTRGLGKLSHVSALRYSADPWTKEVTETGVVPAPTTLELMPSFGYVTEIDDTYTTTAVVLAGTTTIAVDAAFISATSVGDPVRIGQLHWYAVTAVDSTANTITIDRGLLSTIPASTDIEHVVKKLNGLVGQQRVVKLRLLDSLGAPAGHRPITAVSSDPSVVQVLADNLLTNQDGEWSCVLAFEAAGSADISFTGSGTVTLPVVSTAVPTAGTISGTPAGPTGCDVSDYTEEETDWSI